jgi:hypothetical protein
MSARHHCRIPFKYIISIGLLSMSLFAGNAQAQLIDTETIVNNTQTEQDRKYIQDALNREEVRAKLTELGVNPEEIQGRVDSLTAAEVQTLAQDINTLPAGGGNDTVIILLVIILVILLI